MPRPVGRALRSLAALALFGVGAAARADTVAVAFADPSGLNLGVQLRLLRTAEEALRERSSLTVLEQPKAISGAPRRRCGPDDPECMRGLALATRADFALLLAAGASATGLALEGRLVEVARNRSTEVRVKGVSLDTPLPALREIVGGVLPAFARRGWGGLLVEAEPGARIKVDGRAVATAPVSEPLALTAGTHEVDVLLPSGEAELQRVTIPEGTRVPLQLQGNRIILSETVRSAGLSGMRVAAYSSWSAGALSLAGSLVAAGLSRAAASRVQPCTTDRPCSDIEEAMRERRRAEALAGTANVLLGVGVGLSTLGATLFVVDVATPR